MDQIRLMDAVTNWFPDFNWGGMKLVFSEIAGVSQDALHVLLGFFSFLLAAAVMRRPAASSLPWFVVLVAELLNEAVDLASGTADYVSPMWPGSVKDVLTTMAVPTILFLIARLAPGILVRRSPPPAEE